MFKKKMGDYKRNDSTADYDDAPPGGGSSSKRKNVNTGRPGKKTMGSYASKKSRFAGGIID